jgi:hypothetical protein
MLHHLFKTKKTEDREDVVGVCAAAALCRAQYLPFRALIRIRILRCRSPPPLLDEEEEEAHQPSEAGKKDEAGDEQQPPEEITVLRTPGQVADAFSNNNNRNNNMMPSSAERCDSEGGFTMREELAVDYLRGKSVDWRAVWGFPRERDGDDEGGIGGFLSLVELPRYAFDERRHYWICDEDPEQAHGRLRDSDRFESMGRRSGQVDSEKCNDVASEKLHAKVDVTTKKATVIPSNNQLEVVNRRAADYGSVLQTPMSTMLEEEPCGDDIGGLGCGSAAVVPTHGIAPKDSDSIPATTKSANSSSRQPVAEEEAAGEENSTAAAASGEFAADHHHQNRRRHQLLRRQVTATVRDALLLPTDEAADDDDDLEDNNDRRLDEQQRRQFEQTPLTTLGLDSLGAV